MLRCQINWAALNLALSTQRQALGLTIKEAAAQAQVTPNAFRRAEAYHHRDIGMYKYFRLVHWLGARPEDFIAPAADSYLSTADRKLIRRGLIIAMQALDQQGIDSDLADQLETLAARL